MTEQLTSTQQLRAAVKLVKPELLAEVPNDYNARQTFNYLRHRATNYDELLDQQRQRYGNVTPAENKALTQGAADAIIEAFRSENDDLILGKSNSAIASFARKMVRMLGLGGNPELQAIYEATKTLKRSQGMYKSWNERYRRQKEMVLKIVDSASPEIQARVKAVYSANSKDKLDLLQEELFGESPKMFSRPQYVSDHRDVVQQDLF